MAKFLLRTIHLAPYEDIAKKEHADLNPVERFILNWEPAGIAEERKFRGELIELIGFVSNGRDEHA